MGGPTSLWMLKRVTGADPAAGAELSDTVPAGKWWEILSMSVPLVQGLTQTPQPIFIFDDGATIFLEVLGSSAAQAVSTTCRYNLGSGLANSGQVGSGANVHSWAALPNGLLIPAGGRIRTSTLGIGANTDYGAPSYLVREYGFSV